MQDAIDAELDNRDESLDDFENLIGVGQWPDEVRSEREADGRPCLTINRLPQFVRQVTGDIRRMNPAIKILPADNEANEDVAEIIEGMTRHIQSVSDASSVYEWAAECAAACGIGWFRVVTDWEDSETFNQEIRLKPIRNPLSVYWDPLSEMPTREDAEWVFITSDMRMEDFKEAYPDAQPIDAQQDNQINGITNWYNSNSIVIAEYFWKEPVVRELSLLANGTVVEGKAPAALNIVRKRKVTTHKVMWAKISGKDILEGPQEVPCRYIPLVCVPGEEWQVGDRTFRSGVIRFAKDPQRLYNYWRSAQTELVALQPKAPFLVTVKQVQGLEEFWNDANNSNRPYLPYHPDELAGMPQRAQPPVASQGMMAEISLAAEDLKATTGVYDAALGNKSNETSGVAIRQRQMESDLATSIYADNMAKAVELAGRIIVDMIPKVYDTKRIVRIIGADDSEQMVPINGLMQTIEGPMPINDVTKGKYAVKIAVGPNYSTMRQEAAESMMAFVQAFPAAAPVVGDLIAKNMDWPGADQFAERLKSLLPPGVIKPEDMTPEEQQAQAQAMQAQQMQMQMQQQAMQAELQLKMMEAEAKRAEIQIKMAEASKPEGQYEGQKLQLEAMRIEIERMKLDNDRFKALLVDDRERDIAAAKLSADAMKAPLSARQNPHSNQGGPKK
jgi:hypothetical protein